MTGSKLVPTADCGSSAGLSVQLRTGGSAGTSIIYSIFSCKKNSILYANQLLIISLEHCENINEMLISFFFQFGIYTFSWKKNI